jgi:two-component system sensor histidine kinase TctE
MTIRESSLFARLALWISLMLGVGAALLISAAWFYARTAADNAYDRLLLGAAIQMVEGLTVDTGKMIVDLPATAFDLLGLAESDRIFYRIVDPSGQTLTGYDDLEPDIDLASIRLEPRFLTSSFSGEPVRVVVVARALSDPSLPGWAHVIVAQTTQARRTLAAGLISQAVVMIGIMSLLALAGSMLAIRYALKPVLLLADALHRRDPHDLRPIALAVPRELRPFVNSINHFMQRLDQRVSLLQRFVADSAHQIRTPLTALVAQVDLLGKDRLSQTTRQHLVRVQNRAVELVRLTNQLLSHAMVIHRAESVHLEPIDVVDVARRAFRAAVPITIDPDIVVSFEAEKGRQLVRGDAVSLREAIVNVIDNALRHGSISQLTVRVLATADDVSVEVEDDGPGIPAEDWERVTQRFGLSRRQEGSAGLGFSIASEVAAAHGGQLSLRPKDATHGFAIVMTLPRVKDR